MKTRKTIRIATVSVALPSFSRVHNGSPGLLGRDFIFVEVVVGQKIREKTLWQQKSAPRLKNLS